MAKDPVCGMQIEEQQAAARTEYRGKTYYFCSAKCKSEFLSAPDRYAARSDEGTQHHQHGSD